MRSRHVVIVLPLVFQACLVKTAHVKSTEPFIADRTISCATIYGDYVSRGEVGLFMMGQKCSAAIKTKESAFYEEYGIRPFIANEQQPKRGTKIDPPRSPFNRLPGLYTRSSALSRYEDAKVPTLQGIAPFIEDRVRVRQRLRRSAPEIQIADDTGGRVTLSMSGLRSEVITRRRYWELLYLNIWISPILSQGAREEPREWELTVSVSGRFAAGGKPASLNGYKNDFEASGFSEELSWYASRLLNEIVPRVGRR